MENIKSNEEYNKYVEKITPKHNYLINALRAFVVGGIICSIGQLITDTFIYFLDLNSTDAASYTSILLIFLSIILTGFNLYKEITKFAGAGALVPITGFANSVAAPAIEYKEEGEVYGKGVKIFSIAGPVILFGILSAFSAGLIYYILKFII